MINNCNTRYDLDINSDHTPITFQFGAASDLPIAPLEGVPVFKYSAADWEMFRLKVHQLLSPKLDIDIKSLNSKESLDIIVSEFTNAIKTAIQETIPTGKQTDKKEKLPYLILAKIRSRKKLRHRLNKSKIKPEHLKRQINQLTHIIAYEIGKFRAEKFDEKCQKIPNVKQNPGRFFKDIKNIFGDKSKSCQIPNLKDENGNRYCSKQEKAEAFRKHYDGKMQLLDSIHYLGNEIRIKDFVKENDALFTPNFSAKSEIDQTRITNPVSEGIICEIIKQLKIRAAPGPDQINNKVLKNLPMTAVFILSKIFTASLRYGYFPDCWREGDLITILKPGKPSQIINSYRPITLSSAVGKILEKIFQSRFLNYCKDKK